MKASLTRERACVRVRRQEGAPLPQTGMPPRLLAASRGGAAAPQRRFAVTAVLVATHALFFLIGVSWARLRAGAAGFSSVALMPASTPARVPPAAP